MIRTLCIGLCIIVLFCACAASANSSSAAKAVLSTSSESISTSNAQTFAMIEDREFEVADYERFNSPASENGLAGTKITFQGTIKEFKKENDYFYYTIETKDGNWHVGIGLDYGTPVANCEALVGKNVQVFAEYSGFSGLANLPACNLMVTGTDELFDKRMRILTSDGTEYPYVPYFWDCNMALGSEQGQAAIKTTESNKEDVSDDIKHGETVNSSVDKSEPSKSPTMGESNALKSAKNYLDVMAFSYSGLVKQLEYEGYSAEEATYAAENCGADWNTQASKAAKAYLDVMPFSKQDLINQLQYEGYTAEQAAYGASENGY